MLVHPYDIEFTQDSGLANNGRFFGLLMEEYPSIPAAKRKFYTYEIPGRAGELLQDTHTKSNVEFSVPLTLVVPEENQLEYTDYIAQVQRWLRGPGWVKFSDIWPWRYKVLNCQFNTSDRITPLYGECSANFVVEPYKYHDNGLKYYPASEIKYNGYDECMPLYEITGEALGSITINGYTVSINVGQNLIIDTKAQLTYRKSNGQVINTAITGDYKKMRLPNGPVSITATNGLSVKVMPRWGYEL